MTNADAAIRTEIVALLPRLRRFARGLARNPHDADDLVQLALERALRNLGQWQRDTRLDSWLYGIVRNAWIDELRAGARRSRVFAPEEEGATVGSADAQTDPELLSAMRAMEQLGEDQRVVVALVLIEGLSYKEAAELLEVPIGTVTSRLARARETLQSLLGEDTESAG